MKGKHQDVSLLKPDAHYTVTKYGDLTESKPHQKAYEFRNQMCMFTARIRYEFLQLMQKKDRLLKPDNAFLEILKKTPLKDLDFKNYNFPKTSCYAEHLLYELLWNYFEFYQTFIENDPNLWLCLADLAECEKNPAHPLDRYVRIIQNGLTKGTILSCNDFKQRVESLLNQHDPTQEQVSRPNGKIDASTFRQALKRNGIPTLAGKKGRPKKAHRVKKK